MNEQDLIERVQHTTNGVEVRAVLSTGEILIATAHTTYGDGTIYLSRWFGFVSQDIPIVTKLLEDAVLAMRRDFDRRRAQAVARAAS